MQFEKGLKGFTLWDLEARKMVFNRDVVFDEKYMVQQAISYRVHVIIETNMVEINQMRLVMSGLWKQCIKRLNVE